MVPGRAVIEVGEKVHIITRRNFPDDLRRHFAGMVRAVSDTAMRLQGYTFVFDVLGQQFYRRAELRTRIFPIADGQLIINVMPPDTIMDAMKYVKVDGRLMITDGAKFRLDINEFGSMT